MVLLEASISTDHTYTVSKKFLKEAIDNVEEEWLSQQSSTRPDQLLHERVLLTDMEVV